MPYLLVGPWRRNLDWYHYFKLNLHPCVWSPMDSAVIEVYGILFKMVFSIQEHHLTCIWQASEWCRQHCWIAREELGIVTRMIV